MLWNSTKRISICLIAGKICLACRAVQKSLKSDKWFIVRDIYCTGWYLITWQYFECEQTTSIANLAPIGGFVDIFSRNWWKKSASGYENVHFISEFSQFSTIRTNLTKTAIFRQKSRFSWNFIDFLKPFKSTTHCRSHWLFDDVLISNRLIDLNTSSNGISWIIWIRCKKIRWCRDKPFFELLTQTWAKVWLIVPFRQNPQYH